MGFRPFAVGVRVESRKVANEVQHFLSDSDFLLNLSDNGIDTDIPYWRSGDGDTDGLALFCGCILGLVISREGDPPYQNIGLAMDTVRKLLEERFKYTGEIKAFY